MTTTEQLHYLLSRHDGLEHLECDGFTRIASYILAENKIEHNCYEGLCVFGEQVVAPHFWIEAGVYRIDFRLRRWVGNRAPHGIFRLDGHTGAAYDGVPVKLVVTPLIFNILTS